MTSIDQNTLALLGWSGRQAQQLAQLGDAQLRPARVAAVERVAFSLLGLERDPAHALLVRQRLPAQTALEAPTVGDWVACREIDDVPWIEHVLPRASCFVRRAAGRDSVAQLVAANLDLVLAVTAIDDDFNLRRVERYLTAIWASGAQPVLVINKADREHDRAALVEALEAVAPGVPVALTSAKVADGLLEIEALLAPGQTVAFVGSSGVGKSTLINRLLGTARLATGDVREGDGKGRHTTTRRELIVSPTGIVLIDTPGMRELGLWEAHEGLAVAFADVEQLSARCRFRDCSHQREPNCALRGAVAGGLLPAERLASYQRLAAELADNQARAAERPAADAKRRWKPIHKSARTRRKLHRKLGLKDD